jgi:hypothetical protein
LTIEEINIILETLVKQKEEEELKNANLPLNLIAEKPDHAVEHFKSLVNQIYQLALMADAQQFEKSALKTDRLSASEWLLWQEIQKKINSA